jgi:hypothetical protein
VYDVRPAGQDDWLVRWHASVRSAGGARAAGQQESGCIVTVARITEHIRRRASEWPPSSSRLDVGTEALAVLRAAIPPAEPPPYEPGDR